MGGAVVVSRDAIYMVSSYEREEAARQAALLAAGPLGLLFDGLFGGKRSRRKPPPKGLPAAVRRDPEWPVQERAGAVVILTKAEVRALAFQLEGIPLHRH